MISTLLSSSRLARAPYDVVVRANSSSSLPESHLNGMGICLDLLSFALLPRSGSPAKHVAGRFASRSPAGPSCRPFVCGGALLCRPLKRFLRRFSRPSWFTAGDQLIDRPASVGQASFGYKRSTWNAALQCSISMNLERFSHVFTILICSGRGRTRS